MLWNESFIIFILELKCCSLQLNEMASCYIKHCCWYFLSQFTFHNMEYLLKSFCVHFFYYYREFLCEANFTVFKWFIIHKLQNNNKINAQYWNKNIVYFVYVIFYGKYFYKNGLFNFFNITQKGNFRYMCILTRLTLF